MGSYYLVIGYEIITYDFINYPKVNKKGKYLYVDFGFGKIVRCEFVTQLFHKAVEYLNEKRLKEIRKLAGKIKENTANAEMVTKLSDKIVELTNIEFKENGREYVG